MGDLEKGMLSKLSKPQTDKFYNKKKTSSQSKMMTLKLTVQKYGDLKKMKVNGHGRSGLGQGKKSWQWVKHARLYFDLPQA